MLIHSLESKVLFLKLLNFKKLFYYKTDEITISSLLSICSSCPSPLQGPWPPCSLQCCWLYAPDKPKDLGGFAEDPQLLQNLHGPPFLLLLWNCFSCTLDLRTEGRHLAFYCTEAQEQIHHEELAPLDQEEGNPGHQGLLGGHQGPWASQPRVERVPGKWWSCVAMDIFDVITCPCPGPACTPCTSANMFCHFMDMSQYVMEGYSSGVRVLSADSIM